MQAALQDPAALTPRPQLAPASLTIPSGLVSRPQCPCLSGEGGGPDYLKNLKNSKQKSFPQLRILEFLTGVGPYTGN